MKRKAFLCLALTGFASFAPAPANEASSTVATPWRVIDYGWTPKIPFFSLWPNNGEQGLYLQIEGLSLDMSKPTHFTARLYRENGEVVDLTPEGKQLLNAPMSISTVSVPGQPPVGNMVVTFFPWGPNTLEASWIEVSMGTERYWLEIPYGLDRNPQDPLPPPVPGGPPKIIPAMKHLTSHDHVIHWAGVQYDLDKIHNVWNLSLGQSNLSNGQSEAVLHCWGDTLQATLRVLDLHGDGIGISSVTRIERPPDSDADSQPRDVFLLSRIGGDVRCWGQIEITVGSKSCRVVVPSSLYKYTHGHVAGD
ncbi:MAG TPA: hypothetical protein VL981_12630 [Candidatus Methylacidiphilales bacterium]|nr:hypothetical protein [Candidatus Methylacidiphilales bacterium]